jgi:hypothetical protein
MYLVCLQIATLFIGSRWKLSCPPAGERAEPALAGNIQIEQMTEYYLGCGA